MLISRLSDEISFKLFFLYFGYGYANTKIFIVHTVSGKQAHVYKRRIASYWIVGMTNFVFKTDFLVTICWRKVMAYRHKCSDTQTII